MSKRRTAEPAAMSDRREAADPVAMTIVALGDRAVGAHARAWPTPDAASGSAAAAMDIVFGRHGNASGATREGWSVPEAGYTWTLGRRSTLVLPRPRASAPCEARIQLAPLVHSGKLESQRLELDVNGVRLGSLEIAEQAVLSVRLPWALLAGRETVELAFTLPDAARPDALGKAADDRVLGFSFRRLTMTPLDPAGAPLVLAATEAAPLPLKELMLNFESFGENCEFGLVQRACGAEPLGLLRFASAPREKLLRALRARFAGFGEPRNTVVELSQGREFMVQDLAFGINYHAWVKAGEQTPEDIHARELRRLPFLVRKLVEDMTESDKIFVHHGMTPLSDEEAWETAAALRLYGSGVLLWVELADAAHPAGTVRRIGDGLLKGHIDRFAPGDNAHDFSVDGWAAVCRDALRVAAAR